jgi:L-2-hydroxyglutarate oxidase LhgO
MSIEVKITIVVGGVIGCAEAYELSRDSGKNIVVVEKNRQIKGENQSSRTHKACSQLFK